MYTDLEINGKGYEDRSLTSVYMNNAYTCKDRPLAKLRIDFSNSGKFDKLIIRMMDYNTDNCRDFTEDHQLNWFEAEYEKSIEKFIQEDPKKYFTDSEFHYLFDMYCLFMGIEVYDQRYNDQRYVTIQEILDSTFYQNLIIWIQENPFDFEPNKKPEDFEPIYELVNFDAYQPLSRLKIDQEVIDNFDNLISELMRLKSKDYSHKLIQKSILKEDNFRYKDGFYDACFSTFEQQYLYNIYCLNIGVEACFNRYILDKPIFIQEILDSKFYKSFIRLIYTNFNSKLKAFTVENYRQTAKESTERPLYKLGINKDNYNLYSLEIMEKLSLINNKFKIWSDSKDLISLDGKFRDGVESYIVANSNIFFTEYEFSYLYDLYCVYIGIENYYRLYLNSEEFTISDILESPMYQDLLNNLSIGGKHKLEKIYIDYDDLKEIERNRKITPLYF